MMGFRVLKKLSEFGAGLEGNQFRTDGIHEQNGIGRVDVLGCSFRNSSAQHDSPKHIHDLSRRSDLYRQKYGRDHTPVLCYGQK